jgi:hypothetical protein
MDFRLKVVNGKPRAVFPGEDPRRGELLSRLLAPSPYYVTILLWEIIRVEKKRAEGWAFDDSDIRIVCTPESLMVAESARRAHRQENSSRVELSLREAKLLLSKWRYRHLKWEFQQRQTKVGVRLKMKTDISHQEKAIERPVLFRIAHQSGRHLGLAADLVGAISIVSRNRRRSESHSSFPITAIYPDGNEELLPPERYCRLKEVTREDALYYIKRRDEGVRLAKEMGLGDEQISVLLGDQVERCRPDDPEDKQIEGYIRRAPERWLTEEELRVEVAKIFRVKSSGKLKRKASFIFST